MQEDLYQNRYLIHQKNKSETLLGGNMIRQDYKYAKEVADTFMEVMENRRSQRIFNKEVVDVTPILEAMRLAPSSCNRQAISVSLVKDRNSKDILGGLLVGGVGWIHRADTIILLWAVGSAYKATEEIFFMPYLDAGVYIMAAYLAAEVHNIGICFVNPSVRLGNREFFEQKFRPHDDLIFCGALAIGMYDKKAIMPKKRSMEEMII